MSSVTARLRSMGREPEANLVLPLGQGEELEVLQWLRILPGKRLVGQGGGQGVSSRRRVAGGRGGRGGAGGGDAGEAGECCGGGGGAALRGGGGGARAAGRGAASGTGRVAGGGPANGDAEQIVTGVEN